MKRNYAIDALRFVFAVAIVLFHVAGETAFRWENSLFSTIRNASAIVQCFFVISGFFLHYSLNRCDGCFVRFLLNKIARLWPLLFLVTVWMWAAGRLNGTQLFMNSCFLQCVGFTNDYKGITWYVSPLFFSMLFYYGVYASFPGRARYFVVGVLTYVGYLICMVCGKGYFSRGFFLVFVPGGMLQAVAGMGLGLLTASLFENLPKLSFGIGVRIKCTVLEGVFLFMLGLNLFYAPLSCRPLLIVPISMAVVLLLFANGMGLFGSFLGRCGLGHMGRYAYSIYMIQQVGLYYLIKVHRTFAVPSTAGVMCLYTSIIVVIGFLAYYLVECPARKFLSR